MSEESPGPVVLCPFCPVCGSPPLFIAPMMEQTWCTNEECDVFMWVPWRTAAENLADIGHVRYFIDGVEQSTTGPQWPENPSA